MRTFPTAFAAQKNTLTGARPVWMVKIPCANYDAVYISDRSIVAYAAEVVAGTPNPVGTRPWVSSWGTLTEGVSGELGEFSVGEFRFHCVNDANDVNNIVGIIDAYDIETGPAELQLWFEDLDDATPAQVVFSGYIKEITMDRNDYGCEIVIQDSTLKARKQIGTVIDRSLAVFSNADPDDAGKIIPIVFGAVPKVPCVNVVAGVLTTLKADITTGVTIPVSDTTGISTGMVMICDEEEMYVSAVGSGSLTVSRGNNGSAYVVPHTRGTALVQKMSTPLVYLAAEGDVTISKVWGKFNDSLVDITSYCSLFSGSNGQFPGCTGFTISQYATIKKDIDLAVKNSLTALNLADPRHSHSAANSTVLINCNYQSVQSGPSWVTPANCVDGNNSTNGYLFHAQNAVGKTTGVIRFGLSGATTFPAGTPTAVRFHVLGHYTSTEYPSVSFNQVVKGGYLGGGTIVNSLGDSDSAASSFAGVASWADLYASNTFLELIVGYPGYASMYCYVSNVYMEVTYTDSASAALTGMSGSVTPNSTLTGNSLADNIVGSALYADVINTDVTSPLDAVNYLLAAIGFEAATQSGTITPEVNCAITSQTEALRAIHRISFECFALFRASVSGSTLRPRGFGSSVKTVTLAMVRSWQRTRTPYEDIINRIDARYGRDYANMTPEEPYQGVVSLNDVASQSRYGTQENTAAFRLDYIADATSAAATAAAYLAHYAARRWIFEIQVFLDQVEIESGDTVTLDFMPDAPLGLVREARLNPGSATEPDTIILRVEVATVTPAAVLSEITLVTGDGETLQTRQNEILVYTA